MRCTTLVKLPVALSGGSSAYSAPDAGANGRQMSAQGMSRKRIDGDLRLLPDAHVRELRFLVVRDDPDIRQGREGGDLASRSDQLPGLHLAPPQHPVLRRRDGGVAEVELSGVERRALGGDRRVALLDLGRQYGQLALSREGERAILPKLRSELIVNGGQLLAGLGRGGAGCEQAALPREVAFTLRKGGGRGRRGRARRLDVGVLQFVLGFQHLALRARRRHAGLRLGHGGAVIVVDQLGEHLTLTHPLEILNREIPQIAAHLGGDWRDVRLQIGIAGPLPALPALPAVPVGRYHDEYPDGHDEYQDAPGELECLVPIDPGNVHGLAFAATQRAYACMNPCRNVRVPSLTRVPWGSRSLSTPPMYASG